MNILVTGGGGFLGSAIATKLVERGNSVRVFGRNRYPHLNPEIECVQGDIVDSMAVTKACQGMDTVFHVAAIPGVWGKKELFYAVNVDGTSNVLEACRKQRVRKLIYTSSPSVVFGHRPLENANEDTPYPGSYLWHYPETKAIAERMVLEKNGCEGLLTVALRPHLIWGPGDPHLIPRLLQRAQMGRLVQVGEGTNLVDMIYIDNAVHAHLLACDALGPGLGGKVYFVSDDHPTPLWPWINRLLERMNIESVRRSIPYPVAFGLGAVFEFVYGSLGLHAEPRMTRFLAAQLAKSHYFDITRAKHDFGYSPVVSSEEGFERLIEDLKSHPAN